MYRFTGGLLCWWLSSTWWFCCPDFPYVGFPISLETCDYLLLVGERRERRWLGVRKHTYFLSSWPENNTQYTCYIFLLWIKWWYFKIQYLFITYIKYLYRHRKQGFFLSLRALWSNDVMDYMLVFFQNLGVETLISVWWY